MVCDTSKAFIRNYFIQHNREVKKKNQDRTETIFDEVKRKEEF